VKLEPPEGQHECAIAHIDLDRFGLREGPAGELWSIITVGPRRHGQRQGKAEVVEIGGQPRARVEGLVDRAVFSEQEGVRVYGRGQIVIPAIVLPGVQKGQLGQREEAVRAEPGTIAPKLGQRARRLFFEAVREPEAMQRLRRSAARIVSVQDTLCNETMDVLRVSERDADRRGARTRQK